MSTPIPQPPGYPLLGNLTDIDPKSPFQSIKQLAQKYGEIFKLSTLGSDRYILCSERLAAEACDETRFVKGVSENLKQVRNGVGDGLFTAFHGEVRAPVNIVSFDHSIYLLDKCSHGLIMHSTIGNWRIGLWSQPLVHLASQTWYDIVKPARLQCHIANMHSTTRCMT